MVDPEVLDRIDLTAVSDRVLDPSQPAQVARAFLAALEAGNVEKAQFLAIDPATGWLPEDVMTGLLYPNDATGRGGGDTRVVDLLARSAAASQWDRHGASQQPIRATPNTNPSRPHHGLFPCQIQLANRPPPRPRLRPIDDENDNEGRGRADGSVGGALCWADSTGSRTDSPAPGTSGSGLAPCRWEASACQAG